MQYRFAADGTKSEVARTKVIIVTTFDLDEYVMAAINAGASGFLLKDTEPETLLSSIRTVYRDNAIIAPSATKRLIERMTTGAGLTAAPAQPTYTDPELDELTDREREVLIESGNRGQAVHRSAYGEDACGAYLAKINARDRVQAVVFAYENHLV